MALAISGRLWNNTVRRLGGGSLDYLQSRDWSNGGFVYEIAGAQNISKFAGGQGLVTLLTAGTGTAAEGAQLTATSTRVVTSGNMLACRAAR